MDGPKKRRIGQRKKIQTIKQRNKTINSKSKKGMNT